MLLTHYATVLSVLASQGAAFFTTKGAQASVSALIVCSVDALIGTRRVIADDLAGCCTAHHHSCLDKRQGAPERNNHELSRTLLVGGEPDN